MNKAPIVPQIKDKMDISNFDAEFTKSDARNTELPQEDQLIVANFQPQFDDFDYQREYDEHVAKGVL